MSELSEKDEEVLERLRQAEKDSRAVPSGERRPVTNPDKFSFPVGLDDEGKPFPGGRRGERE